MIEPYLDVGIFLKRCKREGRYDEVKNRHGEYWGRCGMSKKDAWKQVIEEYPPLPATEYVAVDDNDSELDSLSEFLMDAVLDGSGVQSLSARIPAYMVWLDRNIGGRLSLDDPAPSRLCLWLWKMANKPEFQGKVLDLVRDNIPPAKMMEGQLKMQDDGGDVLETISRIRGIANVNPTD